VVACRDAHEALVAKVGVISGDATDLVHELAACIFHGELDPDLALLTEPCRDAMSRAGVLDLDGDLELAPDTYAAAERELERVAEHLEAPELEPQRHAVGVERRVR